MLANANIRGMEYRALSNGGALNGTGRKFAYVPANGPGFFGALAFRNSAMAWPSYGRLDRQTAMLAPFLPGTVRGTAAGIATTDAAIEGDGLLASEITGLATTDALGELGAEIFAETAGIAVPFGAIEGEGDMASELLIGGPFTGESLSGELMATEIETGVSLKATLRILLSAMAGKLSGAPTGPILIRDVNNTKNRITATVDANGNRTGITVDGN